MEVKWDTVTHSMICFPIVSSGLENFREKQICLVGLVRGESLADSQLVGAAKCACTVGIAKELVRSCIPDVLCIGAKNPATF